MSRTQMLLGIGLVGAFIVIAAWTMVWYLVSLSFWLWFTLIVSGCGMCLVAAIKRSRWFFIPAALGLIVAAGVSLGATFGR